MEHGADIGKPKVAKKQSRRDTFRSLMLGKMHKEKSMEPLPSALRNTETNANWKLGDGSRRDFQLSDQRDDDVSMTQRYQTYDCGPDRKFTGDKVQIEVLSRFNKVCWENYTRTLIIPWFIVSNSPQRICKA